MPLAVIQIGNETKRPLIKSDTEKAASDSPATSMVHAIYTIYKQAPATVPKTMMTRKTRISCSDVFIPKSFICLSITLNTVKRKYTDTMILYAEYPLFKHKLSTVFYAQPVLKIEQIF